VVDAICAGLRANLVRIHCDAVDLQNGDRISEFMDRMVDSDLMVVIVLSDKYLRSPACMHELFGIYRRCGGRSDGFLRRVIPLVLPDARISQAMDRLQYAGFWKKHRDGLQAALRDIGDPVYAGVAILNEYRLIDEFARNVADMLTYLNDKLFPRDFAQMERDGFKQLVDLINRTTSPKTTSP
jgi:internalin A